jgi:hypothetical protein
MESLPVITSGLNDWDTFEEDYLVDPTVRSGQAAGRYLARPGTEALLKVWRYTRRALTTADKETWDSWQATTVKIGGIPFSWTDPRPGGATWTVRLGSPIKFRPTLHKVGYYDASLHLIEEDET